MHQDVDVLPVEDELTFIAEDFAFDLPCEGPAIWPEYLGKHDSPARWIGLKDCGHHRLLCDGCKERFLALMEEWAAFHCLVCDANTSTFIGFELINRARH